MKKHHYARILTVLVIAVIALSFYRNPEIRTGSRIPPRYASAFNLSVKDPAGHGYFSPRLGIGFTYLAPKPLHIWETGSVIHVDTGTISSEKTIEVFAIDPVPSIAIAIRDNFLQGVSEQDCYVGLLPIATDPYQAAAINYPVVESSDQPWWDTPAAQKCPEKYRTTNGVSYFLMNAEVPDKLVFVKLGQDSLATDGTIVSAGQAPSDWSESIRILE